MTKHAKEAARPKPRSRQGSADKIWAVGLAGATCVGLVGTLGVRVAQDAAASTTAPDPVVEVSSDATAVTSVAVVSSSGLTEEQLDEYARALEAERLRLEAYHAQLLDVAARLQESADSVAQAQGAVPASTSKKAKKANQPSTDVPTKPAAQSTPTAKPKPASKPAAKPAPKPAAAPQVAKPQAQTRGS